MKKKVLATLLVGAMALSMAACGNTASTDTGSTSGTEAATGDAAETEETWTCAVPWPSLNESDTPAGLADIEAALNEITIPAINVAVEIVPIYCYNLNSQQTLSISAGDKLDLVLCMMETNSSYVNNGAIIPLNDLYEQYGADIKAYLGDGVEACAVNGTIYSIPVGGTNGSAHGFAMRSDLMEKYNGSADDCTMTLDELTELFAKVKEGEGDGFYPIAGQPGILISQLDYLGDSTGAVGGVIGGDGKVVNIFASDEYMEFAEYTYQWNQAGYINPDSTASDAPAEQVAAGNYGGQFAGAQPGQADWVAQTAGYDMTMITIAGCEAYGTTTSLNTVSWAISSTCDNPEKAMQLINFMYADNDFSTIFGTGLEGQTYEVVDSDDEGHIIVTFPEGQDMSTVPYYNLFGVFPKSKAQWAPTTLEYFDELDAYNESVVYSPAMGYTFDFSEYSSIVSAVQSVISQYQEAINGGKVDPATYVPEFVSALEANGIDQLIEANQAQYDAWVAAQQ